MKGPLGSLHKMQRHACLWITSALKTSPMGAAETLVGMPLIHLHGKKLVEWSHIHTHVLQASHAFAAAAQAGLVQMAKSFPSTPTAAIVHTQQVVSGAAIVAPSNSERAKAHHKRSTTHGPSRKEVVVITSPPTHWPGKPVVGPLNSYLGTQGEPSELSLRPGTTSGALPSCAMFCWSKLTSRSCTHTLTPQRRGFVKTIPP
jgi:hypothetical protein